MKPLDSTPGCLPEPSTPSTCNNIIDLDWCQLNLPDLHGYPNLNSSWRTNKLSCRINGLCSSSASFPAPKTDQVAGHTGFADSTGAYILITLFRWSVLMVCGSNINCTPAVVDVYPSPPYTLEEQVSSVISKIMVLELLTSRTIC